MEASDRAVYCKVGVFILAFYWRSAASCSTWEAVCKGILFSAQRWLQPGNRACLKSVQFAALKMHTIVHKQLGHINTFFNDYRTIVIVWRQANIISVCTPAQLKWPSLVNRQHLPVMQAIHCWPMYSTQRLFMYLLIGHITLVALMKKLLLTGLCRSCVVHGRQWDSQCFVVY